MDELLKEELLGTLGRLVRSFQAVLYQEDEQFLENMKTHSLQKDDISRYRFWEWTQGVGLFGLWKLYEATGEASTLDILKKYYRERLAEGLPGKNVNTMAPMLALSFLYERTRDAAYEGVIREWAQALVDDFPRTEEGGFQHITSDTENHGELWDDTLYMAVLFLANAGRILNREDWRQEAEYQFLLHIKYLTDRENGLWYHGWTFDGRHHFAGAHWGRGNAWITAAIPEYLRIADPLPATRRFLEEAYRSQVRALADLQDEQGMWHTLLDDPTSYQEASATAGIGYGVMAGLNMGLLEDGYRVHALRAIRPILDLVDAKGVLQQVSYGTPMGRDDLDFYRRIPIRPMPYGQAMAMLFLTETLKIKSAGAAKRLILFLDSGDTLIDEGTEERGADGIVRRARLIEGAEETLRALYAAGYTIALVADGDVRSFENMYRQHHLEHCFAARSISEAVGEQKPAASMFQTAMDLLGLTDADKPRILMVGNNIRRDIAGANRFGIRSALLTWSPRYGMRPENAEQTPTFTISKPRELLPLVERLEAELEATPLPTRPVGSGMSIGE